MARITNHKSQITNHKSQGSVSKIKCFIAQKSMLYHYYIRDVKDGIQIRV